MGVQSSTEFQIPASRQVLQWDFDQRLAHANALEHRATVIFLLDGVLHYAAGSWQSSKKLAQRDAADRALGLIGACNHLLVPCTPSTPDRTCNANEVQLPMGQYLPCDGLLELYCRQLNGGNDGSPPRWSCVWEDDSLCRANVEL